VNSSTIVFAEDLPGSTIHDRVARGELTKLARGIYTTDVDADPVAVTRRAWREIVSRRFPDGVVTELPRTRDSFGAVTGLVWADDGLYVLDRKNALGEAGMRVWRWREDTTATLYNEDTSNRFPYDLARDAQGNLYISAIVIGNESEIMRLTPQLEMSVWWKAPKKTSITGLAYQAATDTILAVDTNASDIYAIPAATPADSTLLYHNVVNPAPQLDGLIAAADGTVYVAALGLNRVAALSPTLDLTYLAGAFRGSSRVAYDATRRRLYVNNWDQRSLLADQMLFVKIDVTPKLPFALDVIEWK